MALSSGEFDAVASAATITDERKRWLTSTTYFSAGRVLVVKRAATSHRWTIWPASGSACSLAPPAISGQRKHPGRGGALRRVTLAFQALGNGDVDAIINDAPVGRYPQGQS